MRADVLLRIRNDINLSTYIKYHSYWYKELIRNPNRIITMEEEMKKEYKLTMGDKIARLNSKVEIIRTFLEVMK